ncbi:hypothetical protein DXN05_03100 [Deminuibacter soli]|uniref:Murein L,D-transpeptidase catalytic domain family protein n=2 Tax=Deminuibacter soli TaxID=2291815 RepID=A0A3E1NRT0_9BACT|nr:hypothetical protein DXN05_03100 [Deminuibacter soli]
MLHAWRWIVAIFVLFTAFGFCFVYNEHTTDKPLTNTRQASQPIATDSSDAVLYTGLHLDSLGLSKQAFDNAMHGYKTLQAAGKLQNDQVLSIVDFSLPSSQKRLFVIDLKNARLLFNTYVSHGRGSGAALATEFSNQANSFKSSLGFYVTGDTYIGHHGYSLRLNGQEKGINDNALSRGIVMHSAAYVDSRIAAAQGFIGRSQGCPAIPAKEHKAIIAAIRNGSCLFLYSADKKYAASSTLARSNNAA